MIFSYNWLKQYVKLPKPEELAEVLTMHSFEVEELKKIKGDYVLDIDVLPNRGHDCLSHWGVAREISAILDRDLEPLKRKRLKKEKGEIGLINLKIKCPKLVPRYSAIVVEGVKVGPSPKWLKEKIESVGLRSINNIVDLTNYVMLEIGQPLHAFDYDKIQGHQMILRESKNGEKLVVLDDSSHTLDRGMLVIEDKSRLIDLVGIMGGKLTEIDSKTKNIVLQAGNFDRQTIYKAVRKLNHRTEASNIYSQGIDPNLTISTLERAYFLLTKLCEGKIVQIIDFYPKKVQPKKIKLDLSYVEKLLGLKIFEKEVRKILERLGLEIKNCKLKILNVVVPTFRLDISLQEDLIEEIGRIYGYEKIPSTFPVVSLIPPKRNLEIFWENMTKDILKELGFTEVYNYSFVEKGIVELENPMSSRHKYLRPSLIQNLLKNVKDNLKYFKEIKIFELGKVFDRQGERRMLTGASTNNFYQVKGTVDSLLNKLGISDIYYDEYKPESIWIKGKCAEIKVGGEKIGCLGQISADPHTKQGYGVGVVVFDIDFEKLTKLCSEEHEYQPISQYPAAVRDLALLVPMDVKVVDVLNKINIAGGVLVRDVDLFDIYEGESIAQGKKNLAFHIVYQAEDRTLTSKEIDAIQNKIIKALEKDPDWEVRR